MGEVGVEGLRRIRSYLSTNWSLTVFVYHQVALSLFLYLLARSHGLALRAALTPFLSLN
jgi:hypothetical protein